MPLKPRAFATTAMAALFCAGHGFAQMADPLKAAVEKAVQSNPDVTSRFSALRAATDAVGVARSGLLPRLDVAADVGRQSDRYDTRNPASETFTRSGVGLSLTQLLWDGLGTQRDVERAGHDRLTRYFELLDATEQTALEATRAYIDVLRYRRLVRLAEDNYVEHRDASQRIRSKFSAGVGSGVDLEQANARLALAESNLTTELANLHDVSARYLRVVGEAPPKGMLALPTLSRGLPASVDEVLATAVRQSPAVSASIEALRAARSAASTREAAFQPRLEARARAGGGKNYQGLVDQTRDSAVEVVLNWNLFNGGADQARVRQQVNLVNQAADLRDKACRDLRQQTAIAFNDIRKLNDQLAQLDRNTLAIEKARDAYRQQFDIGKRSLLDLLNAENELYTARRAYANAEHDRALAFARTQAGMTTLTAQLGIARANGLSGEMANWAAGNDAPARCPVQTVDMAVADFDALAQRVASTSTSTVPVPVPVTAAAPAPIRPLPLAEAATAVPPPTMTAPSGVALSALARRLNEWAAAWEAKDADRYLAFYAADFRPARGSAEAWRGQRHTVLAKPAAVALVVSNVVTTSTGASTAETRFTQDYRSGAYHDTTTKVLGWALKRGQWEIVTESGR